MADEVLTEASEAIASELGILIAAAPPANFMEDDYNAGYIAALTELRDSGTLAALVSLVEQHTNGRHVWPKTTPTGFTYERPTTYAELEHMIGHMVQSEIECWDEPERPPEPVWEMIGIAQQEVGRERARAEKAEATIARVEKLQGDLFQQGGNLIAQWGAARLIRAALQEGQEGFIRAALRAD